jgi:hypothetical protein
VPFRANAGKPDPGFARTVPMTLGGLEPPTN